MAEKDMKKQENIYENNVDYIKLARSGDKAALDKLIELNLPLVSAVSKKFMNRGYEYEDIYQIGCIGLLKAINNFDINYNVKFSTYAVPMIIGEIKRFLRDDGIIKVSRSVKSMARKLHYQREELYKALGREPSITELSNYTGIDTEDIIFATESSNNMEYLYDTVHQDDGAPVLLIDKLSGGSSQESGVVDKIALKEVIKDLDCRSRQIILLRYFKDKTQMEVAKMLGINQVQVSRIEKKVLNYLKEKLA